MTARNDGGPAFAHDPGGPFPQQVSGITVRDYFAAAAMQGFLAEGTGFPSDEKMARASYEIADAMLAERAK